MADAIVAVSRDVRQAFLQTYSFPNERIRVILNGIDTERFSPLSGDLESARKQTLGLTGNPLVGTVCRLISYKGIATLLESFLLVLRREPASRLVLAGEGPDRSSFEEQARKLGLGSAVHFLGSRRDVDTIYPLLDVFVLPSYTEGISLTILEAASCQVPIVATNVGGNPEIITHGQTGLLVPPRDANALANAILEQWTTRKAALNMGRAARERVVHDFSLDRMAEEYLTLYRQIYERKTQRRRR